MRTPIHNSAHSRPTAAPPTRITHHAAPAANSLPQHNLLATLANCSPPPQDRAVLVNNSPLCRFPNLPQHLPPQQLTVSNPSLRPAINSPPAPSPR